jgi:thiamine biosynthesis lipoprotein
MDSARNARAMSEIHIFNHSAMATSFQVRIAGEEKTYAAQAAAAAFALVDNLENKLSRFRANSEIAQIAQLDVGEKMRLTEPVLACLRIAQRMEFATRGAFSITAAALKTQPTRPLWSLVENEFSIRCDSGKLEFDLGAIGKGFALDRMAEVLREWSCPAFLLIAGGSSILAGDAPPERGCVADQPQQFQGAAADASRTAALREMAGWNCGLGGDLSPQRYLLKNISLSGSGLAVKGEHILDPRTGLPGTLRHRAWALADAAAESDALSTAAMLLREDEIAEILARNERWLIFLQENENWRHLGQRPLPPGV